MNTGSITLALNVSEFAPTDSISGVATWQVGRMPESGSVNLFWYASQRDGPHVHPVASLPILDLAKSGTFEFSFKAPESPYSYDGTLFQCHWALELLLEPALLDVREKVVVSPSREPLSFES